MTEGAGGTPGRLRVLHLAGSAVDDFHADLSRLYAAGCLAAITGPDGPDGRGGLGHLDHVVAWVEPGGGWRFPADLSPEALGAAPLLGRGEGLARLAALEVDVALPQMFCRPGMTDYRSLLAALGIPVVGNTGETMALGAHKARARAVVAAAGVRVPDGELLRGGERPTLPPPVVVKPADADNSHGLALVRTADEYDAALAAARTLAADVLVEAYVPVGREVRCGVLERDGELHCLPLEEYAVDETIKPVRDAADKLARRDDGDLRLVAKDPEHAWIVPLDDPVTPAVHDLARAVHVALGCRHHSLVDVRVAPDQTLYFLEASLYCSFAPSSVVVTMAEAAGLRLPDLLASQLAEALRRR